ncbi:UNVERIFIED_CONTAM: hypothetical protein HDU68_006077, partial [Siphonaria sp. JEL0065]
MPNQTVKVVYQHEHISATEHSDTAFFAYADKDMLTKWRGDKTVPLVDVLESFQVYQSDNKGASGIQSIASKAELKNAFGSEDTTAVLQEILGKGKEHAMPRDSQPSSALRPHTLDNASNSTRSSPANSSVETGGAPTPAPTPSTSVNGPSRNLQIVIDTNSQSESFNSPQKKKKKGSVAFYVQLDDGNETIISPSSPSFPVFQRNELPQSAADNSLHVLRLTRAHYRRLALLHIRSARLRRHWDNIQYKVVLQQQKDRIKVLKMRANLQYKEIAADLNRRVILGRVLARCQRRRNAEAVAHASSSLSRAVALRRALSENFVEFLEDTRVREESGGSSMHKSLRKASSVDVLRTWEEETEEEEGSDYYGGEEYQIPSPPSSADSSEGAVVSPLNMREQLAEIMYALRMQNNTSISSDGGSMTSYNDSTSDHSDHDLLAQFESTYGPNKRSTMDTTLRINDLFATIKSLKDDKDRIPPLSPVSASSSYGDDTLEPLTETFSSPKKRSMISTARLSELLALNEALLGIGATAGIVGGGSHSATSAGIPAGSPTRRRSSFATMSPSAKLLRKRDLLDEPLSDIIERNKSLPVKMLDMLDESDYMELVPLLPPITRFTLRELDMDEILLNPQLRHDLYFDPNLQFKPNTDGERGTAKRLKTQQYWDKVTQEILNKETYRIPLLVHEIKQIVKELLPYSQATHAE